MLELSHIEPKYFEKEKARDWWSSDIESTLKLATELSADLDHQFVGIEHVLYCLLKESNTVQKFLITKNVPCEEIAETIIGLLNPFEEKTQGVSQEKDSDGFLYIEYAKENVFG